VSDLIIQGIYIPRIFIMAFIAVMLTLLLRFILIKANLMNAIWHPALFESAVFVVLLQLLSNLTPGI